MDKINLLYSIIDKSLNQFNLEVAYKDENVISYSSKDNFYVIVFQIDLDSEVPRLYWTLSFNEDVSHIFISEFSFRFDNELEFYKNRTKKLINALENIQKFKFFVSKIFKSVFKGDMNQ